MRRFECQPESVFPPNDVTDQTGNSLTSNRQEVSMKRINGLVIGLFLCTAFAFAAEQTWTGQISDSSCGESHQSAMEHAGKKLSAHDCAVACVKNGGKYVFVVDGKTYAIANQDFSDLEKQAGSMVKLTGEMKGDTITVTKIVTSGKS
jgi:hypothetical protein